MVMAKESIEIDFCEGDNVSWLADEITTALVLLDVEVKVTQTHTNHCTRLTLTAETKTPSGQKNE